jgi:hypothetical protein
MNPPFPASLTSSPPASLVLHHDRLDPTQLFSGAERHELGAGLVRHRDVTGRRKEGVACLEDLITVGIPSGHLALDDVTTMRAMAAVVRKPFQEGVESKSSRSEVNVTV